MKNYKLSFSCEKNQTVSREQLQELFDLGMEIEPVLSQSQLTKRLSISDYYEIKRMLKNDDVQIAR